MEYKDYYKIMGVSRDAPQEEIKRAYRKLARKYHPDVSKESDAEERFKELGEAYEVLKDPQKREAYDQLGQRWKHGQEFHPPPGWDAGFDFGGEFTETDAGGFSDFFESLFGQFRPGHTDHRTGFRVRGEDIHARLLVALEESYRGATRTITLDVPQYDEHGRVANRRRTLRVHIPRGVTEGQRIRLAGEGGRGFGKDSPPGDLYLEIGFEPHRLFHAEGRDIHVTLPIAPWEAALGARVDVPTLGGTVEMKIPEGSQSGRKLRLKGRGLPGTPPGDEIVVLRIVTPPAKSDKARKAYEALAEAAPFNPRARLETTS